jgi:hypothetical protein
VQQEDDSVKFRIKKRVKTEATEEVEFDLPRYAAHHMDSSVIYSMLALTEMHNLVRHSITIDEDGNVELETDTCNQQLDGSGEYFLGLGDFKSDGAEWTKALQVAGDRLDRMRMASQPVGPEADRLRAHLMDIGIRPQDMTGMMLRFAGADHTVPFQFPVVYEFDRRTMKAKLLGRGGPFELTLCKVPVGSLWASEKASA